MQVTTTIYQQVKALLKKIDGHIGEFHAYQLLGATAAEDYKAILNETGGAILDLHKLRAALLDELDANHLHNANQERLIDALKKQLHSRLDTLKEHIAQMDHPDPFNPPKQVVKRANHLPKVDEVKQRKIDTFAAIFFPFSVYKRPLTSNQAIVLYALVLDTLVEGIEGKTAEYDPHTAEAGASTPIDERDIPVIDKTQHRVVLLKHLGIVDLLDKLPLKTKAQKSLFVAALLGITDPAEIESIRKALSKISLKPTQNGSIETANALNKIDGELIKVGLSLEKIEAALMK